MGYFDREAAGVVCRIVDERSQIDTDDVYSRGGLDSRETIQENKPTPCKQ
jgi:hypothetical protein